MKEMEPETSPFEKENMGLLWKIIIQTFNGCLYVLIWGMQYIYHLERIDGVTPISLGLLWPSTELGSG